MGDVSQAKPCDSPACKHKQPCLCVCCTLPTKELRYIFPCLWENECKCELTGILRSQTLTPNEIRRMKGQFQNRSKGQPFQLLPTPPTPNHKIPDIKCATERR